jgi:hypothetical protein
MKGGPRKKATEIDVEKLGDRVKNGWLEIEIKLKGISKKSKCRRCEF